MSSSNPTTPSPLSVGVIIATKGRPECIPPLIAMLEAQTQTPSIVVFSVTGKQDLPADMEARIKASRLNISIIDGPAGSACQRNKGIEPATECSDIFLFIDDDFLLAQNWVQQCAALFADQRDLVALTGTVIADGITGAALSWDQASSILSNAEAQPIQGQDQKIPDTYGCNMAFRVSALADERFDERFPLYGWMEDKDLSRRIARKGRIIKAASLRGVHLGARGNRTSGLRFGYSQMVNPYYIHKKGLLSLSELTVLLLRPLAMNILKSLRPEPHIDRWGRFKGNLIGLTDIALRREDPERILQF